MRCWTRLYETDDGKLVEEHDPRGKRLFCKPGDEIDDERARKYGLLPPLEKKQVEPEQVENKMVNQPENKDWKTDDAVGKTRSVVIKRLRKDKTNV